MSKRKTSESTRDSNFLTEIIAFLTSKTFIKNLIFIGLFIGLVLFLVFTWLRFYTNHGQKLELPDYIGEYIKDAEKDAKDKTFDIIVNDSVHIVGKKGGLIREQNPKPGSMVKENRKIYVTVTKHQADKIKVGELTELYGRDYNRKKNELAYKNINCVVKSRRYDSGEPDHILEVWYKGQRIIGGSKDLKNVEIEIGDTLEFVLSSDGGGEQTIPNLVCKKLSEARFELEILKLEIGRIGEIGDISNMDDAYIVSQSPEPSIVDKISMGESINVTISTEKPAKCQ